MKNIFWINARYDSECSECGEEIIAGDRIVFDTETRHVYCGECGGDIAGDDPAAWRGK
jgi:ribosomal protein S27E